MGIISIKVKRNYTVRIPVVGISNKELTSITNKLNKKMVIPLIVQKKEECID